MKYGKKFQDGDEVEIEQKDGGIYLTVSHGNQGIRVELTEEQLKFVNDAARKFSIQPRQESQADGTLKTPPLPEIEITSVEHRIRKTPPDGTFLACWSGPNMLIISY